MTEQNTTVRVRPVDRRRAAALLLHVVRRSTKGANTILHEIDGQPNPERNLLALLAAVCDLTLELIPGLDTTEGREILQGIIAAESVLEVEDHG
jgi:hypothetical protein